MTIRGVSKADFEAGPHSASSSHFLSKILAFLLGSGRALSIEQRDIVITKISFSEDARRRRRHTLEFVNSTAISYTVHTVQPQSQQIAAVLSTVDDSFLTLLKQDDPNEAFHHAQYLYQEPPYIENAVSTTTSPPMEPDPTGSDPNSQSSGGSSSTSVIAIAASVGALLLAGLIVTVAMLRRRRLQHGNQIFAIQQQLDQTQTEVQALRRAWEIAPEDLVLGEVIGRGGFGRVYAGKWGDHAVAVKVILGELLMMDESLIQEFDKEIGFLQTVRHANIVMVRLIASFISRTR